MSDKYAGNPNKSLEFLFYGVDPSYPSVFENFCQNGYPDIVVINLLKHFLIFERKEKNKIFLNMFQ